MSATVTFLFSMCG